MHVPSANVISLALRFVIDVKNAAGKTVSVPFVRDAHARQICVRASKEVAKSSSLHHFDLDRFSEAL